MFFFVINRFLISTEDETLFYPKHLLKHVHRSKSQLQTSRHRKKRISDLKDYEKQFTKLKWVKKQHADWEKMEQKSELPRQWLPKQNREKRSSRQSQKRKQSKKQQNKRQKPKASSKRWNDIYSVWLWKKRACGNGGVKICIRDWWNENIIHFRIVFWTDCCKFQKSLLKFRRK